MTILVADIGATNARFQLADDACLIGDPVVLPTAAFDDSLALLAHAARQLDGSQLDAAVLAVAGPVDKRNRTVQVTNTGLRFDGDAAVACLGCEVQLINDFFALAHAVPTCRTLVQVGGEDLRGEAGGVKALLGPGSGLGMATLVPLQERWLVLASEGGHADLAPGSYLEAELWGLLTQAHGHVSWETVLCGEGLVRLYGAVCELWGGQAQPLTAREITARGVEIEDPICHQTLETFCGLLGAAAGNLALTVAATGGVYIGGGIAPQIVEFIRSSPLRRRFDERGSSVAYVREIPLWVIVEEAAGLRGALDYFKLFRRATNG